MRTLNTLTKSSLVVAIVVALFCSLTVLSPSTLQAQDKNAELPLYPLKKGLKWESANKDGDKSVSEITGIVTKNDMVCYEIISEFKAKSDGFAVKHYSYIAAKEDGFYFVATKTTYPKGGLADEVRSFHPPQCFLKPPSKQAKKWNWKNDNLSIAYVQHADTINYKGKEVEATLVISEPSYRDVPNAVKTQYFFWYLPGKGIIKSLEKQLEGDGKWYTYNECVNQSFSGFGSVKIGEIVLNENEIEKDAANFTVEAEDGVVTTFKKSRTITREVSFSQKNTKVGVGDQIGAKFGIDLKFITAEVSGEVKKAIEKEMGQKLSDSETYEQTVTIDGSKIRKAKVHWIDTYRTGTVQVTVDGNTVSVPFQFPIGTKLVIRKQ